MSDKSNSGNSVGFCGLLLLAFIVLKLCSVIDWSWWWVMAPLWIPIAFALLLIAGYFALAITADLLEIRARKRAREKRDKSNER